MMVAYCSYVEAMAHEIIDNEDYDLPLENSGGARERERERERER